MATNEGRYPDDPRRPHAGDDPLDTRPGPTTDPFGTRPGEVRGDPLAPSASSDPAYRADPVADRTDRTYGDDRMARPARGRSGSAWAWTIGAIVVLAAALAFFLSDGYEARDVPVTGAIEEPATEPVPIDPQADTPVAPAEPITPQ